MVAFCSIVWISIHHVLFNHEVDIGYLFSPSHMIFHYINILLQCQCLFMILCLHLFL